jgi:hypothetical protein
MCSVHEVLPVVRGARVYAGCFYASTWVITRVWSLDHICEIRLPFYADCSLEFKALYSTLAGLKSFKILKFRNRSARLRNWHRR